MDLAKAYWDSYFEEEKETTESFDWLVGWDLLKPHLEPYLKPEYRILIIGCGSSRLGIDLYLDGYRNVTNMDISPNV